MLHKSMFYFILLLLYCSSAVSQFTNDTLWEKPINTTIRGIMYSPDNKYLSVVGDGIMPMLLDPLTGVLLKEFNDASCTGSLFGAFSPDSKYFAYSGHYLSDNVLRIWDVDKNEIYKRIEMQNGSCSISSFWASVVFTNDGKYLWTRVVNQDGNIDINDKILVFDTETWKIVKSFEGIQGSTMKISKDGRHIGAADPGINLLVFDTHSMELYKIFSSNTENHITDFAFSPDGKYIAATSENTIYLWSIETGELVKEIKDENISRYKAITFSPNSNYIIIGVIINNQTWETSVYDINNWQIVHKYPDLAFSSIAITNDSKYIAFQNIIVYGAKWGETGLIEDKPIEEIIYPNPTDGIVTINLNLIKPEKINVNIFNETGFLIQNLYDGIAETGLILNWDCSKQAAGVYLCRIEGERTFKTVKILKK